MASGWEPMASCGGVLQVSSSSDMVSYSSSSTGLSVCSGVLCGNGVWIKRRGLFSSLTGVIGLNVFLVLFNCIRSGTLVFGSAWGRGSRRVARWAMVLAIAGRMVVNKSVICLTAGIRAAQQGGFWVGTVGGVNGERTTSAYKVFVGVWFLDLVFSRAADGGISSRRAWVNRADSFWNFGQTLDRTSCDFPHAAHFGVAEQFFSSWVPSWAVAHRGHTFWRLHWTAR